MKKFIVNTFDKTSMYKVAYLLKGEVVNQNETLVIVKFKDEYSLSKKLDLILNDYFEITEYRK